MIPFYTGKPTPGTSLVGQWLRICASNAGGWGSIPGWGTKIPLRYLKFRKKQNIKQKQYYNKFNKEFLNGLHKKKILKIKGPMGHKYFEASLDTSAEHHSRP